ncbi:type II secretion system protein GspG [Candidatus Poribacteria bacterium]|nr:type II secretion system protein GspG [Candidatus Poribacteria bacterium]
MRRLRDRLDWLRSRIKARVRGDRGRDDGFTLVEILVVITILGVLIAVVSPTVLSRIDQAKVTAARVQMREFSSALEQYAIDTGDYPASEDGLDALYTEPETAVGWLGPYMPGSLKSDPWGNAYVYVYPGDHQDVGYAYDLTSYGKDGKEGGEDFAADISNYGESEEAL